MADGAELAGGIGLTHTMYIWPTRELGGQSRQWSQRWHAAFAEAAAEIGRLVATCVLGGLRISPRPITLQLPAGRIGFSIRLQGASIYIAVATFEGPQPGPDAPSPNGGRRRQPAAADGLILGLRGSGRSFTMVTFYGPLQPLPAGQTAGQGPGAGRRGAPAPAPARTGPRIDRTTCSSRHAHAPFSEAQRLAAPTTRIPHPGNGLRSRGATSPPAPPRPDREPSQPPASEPALATATPCTRSQPAADATRPGRTERARARDMEGGRSGPPRR